jgi:hypothetical protein
MNRAKWLLDFIGVAIIASEEAIGTIGLRAVLSAEVAATILGLSRPNKKRQSL